MQVTFKPDREPNDLPSGPVSGDEVRYWLRQQSLLGEFGRFAMQTRDFRKILQQATELCASGLQAPFAKVLEYEPDEKRLMVRAGVGWPPGTIDIVSLAVTLDRRPVTPTGPESPSYRTTWRRKPASARLSYSRITASGAQSTC